MSRIDRLIHCAVHPHNKLPQDIVLRGSEDVVGFEQLVDLG